MNTRLPDDPRFNKYYNKHCKHLKLKGLRPKTIEAYARAIRRMGNYFDAQIDRVLQTRITRGEDQQHRKNPPHRSSTHLTA